MLCRRSSQHYLGSAPARTAGSASCDSHDAGSRPSHSVRPHTPRTTAGRDSPESARLRSPRTSIDRLSVGICLPGTACTLARPEIAQGCTSRSSHHRLRRSCYGTFLPGTPRTACKPAPRPRPGTCRCLHHKQHILRSHQMTRRGTAQGCTCYTRRRLHCHKPGGTPQPDNACTRYSSSGLSRSATCPPRTPGMCCSIRTCPRHTTSSSSGPRLAGVSRACTLCSGCRRIPASHCHNDPLYTTCS